MPLAAGRLTRKVQFRRRAAMPAAAGDLRGGFEDYGAPEWADFQDGRGSQGRSWDVNVSGVALPARIGTLTIRDSAWARTITRADQVVIEGAAFEITGIGVPERPLGAIDMDVVEAPSAAGYARLFDQRGETVAVRRLVANGTPVEAVARAIVTGYAPQELVAGIQQGDRKILLSAADLVAAGWPVPPRTNDEIIVRGRMLNVADVDDSSHRTAGVLNAYQIRATG